MYLPSVERFKCHGEGLVGYSVIEQTAYNADASVGIALREAERVRGRMERMQPSRICSLRKTVCGMASA